MEVIIVWILSGITLALCISLAYLFCMNVPLYDWDNYSRDYIRIKFKTFLSFYRINPNHWRRFDDNVEYRPNHTTFGFSLFDWIRYKIWKKRLRQWERKQEHLKQYQQTLELIKKDLEEFNRENNEMMQRETEKYAKAVDEVPRMFEDYGRKTKLMMIDEDPHLKLTLKMQEIMNDK